MPVVVVVVELPPVPVVVPLVVEPPPVPLVVLVHEVAAAARHKAQAKGLEIEIEAAPAVTPDTLRGDPTRLSQALMNLLTNAVKFTAKGWVRLKLELLREERERRLLRFSVTDTGIGIPAGKRHLLFRPFQQLDTSGSRRYGGAGLGLARHLSRRPGRHVGEAQLGDVPADRIDDPAGRQRRAAGALAVAPFVPAGAPLRKFTARTCRTMLRGMGLAPHLIGAEHLPAGPAILVANHASYMDVLVLCAALPPPFRFVAKRELLESALTRLYLRGLGTQFVERFDARQSVEDARRLAETVKAGISMGFFPEGTFTRRAGLMPFRLGAFAAAVSAGVPVLPVAIRGARTLLRDGQRLPRHSAISIAIGEPAYPPASAKDAFAAAVALRDIARSFILAHCGEMDAGSNQTPD